MSADNAVALPPGVAGVRAQAGQLWRSRQPRERQLIAGGAIALAVLIVWLVAVQPALRTLREAPAELDRLDTQWQQMQLAAFESAARARPVEAQLLKGASGYSGSISITLAGNP